MLLALLLLQTVPGPPGDQDVALPRLTQERQCPRGTDDIIVCGGGVDSQRLDPLPERPADPMLPPAALHLSGGKTLSAHGEEGGGYTATPRAMVTLKIPF